MDVRQPINEAYAKDLDTGGLRREFLVETIFDPGTVTATYSHLDRLMVGGFAPDIGAVSIPAELSKAIAADFLLQRRELGLINIGGPAIVEADGQSYEMAPLDGLYIGRGTRDVACRSTDPTQPAKLYYNSVPAHADVPTTLVTRDMVTSRDLGSDEACNRRTIHNYFNDDAVSTCQLSMGLTRIAPGSVWNTMPPHTHERRMEVYFYFDIDPDQTVFHLMGAPRETRHIVVANDQAVISPSWSIHSGVGTASYSFIWSMAGENKAFDDMDHLAATDLR